MVKGYWITLYRKVNDPTKMEAYKNLAGPAITAGGGRFIVRGEASKVYEAGIPGRVVVIERLSETKGSDPAHNTGQRS